MKEGPSSSSFYYLSIKVSAWQEVPPLRKSCAAMHRTLTRGRSDLDEGYLADLIQMTLLQIEPHSVACISVGWLVVIAIYVVELHGRVSEAGCLNGKFHQPYMGKDYADTAARKIEFQFVNIRNQIK